MNSLNNLLISKFLIKRSFDYRPFNYKDSVPGGLAAAALGGLGGAAIYNNARGSGIGSIQPLERAQPSAAIRGLATHNLGANSSNVNPVKPPAPTPALATTTNPNYPNARARHQETILAGKPPVTAAPAATATATAPVVSPKPISTAAANQPDLNAMFKKYMGSAFNPNNKTDKAKMQYMQGLHNKGVTLNAANIYDKAQGYGKF